MYLGIDVGTSGVKAVVIDELGDTVAHGAAALRVSRPRDLWSEQNPDDWWDATTAAVGHIDPELRHDVRAIGLAGQMHGATLLGSDDRPLRPAILWNDGRSFAECRELESLVPEMHAITGNLAMPGFTAPKLIWVRRHEPALFAATRTVLLPKDYLISNEPQPASPGDAPRGASCAGIQSGGVRHGHESHPVPAGAVHA